MTEEETGVVTAVGEEKGNGVVKEDADENGVVAEVETNGGGEEGEGGVEDGGDGEEREGDGGEFVVRARGLPWSATEAEIKKFFGDAADAIRSVAFTYNREGRPSGEVYVEFNSKTAFNKALGRDHANMGHRYIEVFASEKSEMEEVVGSRGEDTGSFKDDSDPVVRLRGLPYGCTKEEISNFFTGLEITPNGIVMPCDQSGRPSGEAFVQFMNKDTAEQAIKRHMNNIGSRYIEVFRSSRDELGSVMRRLGTLPASSGGLGLGGGGGWGRGGGWSSE